MPLCIEYATRGLRASMCNMIAIRANHTLRLMQVLATDYQLLRTAVNTLRLTEMSEQASEISCQGFSQHEQIIAGQ